MYCCELVLWGRGFACCRGLSSAVSLGTVLPLGLCGRPFSVPRQVTTHLEPQCPCPLSGQVPLDDNAPLPGPEDAAWGGL